MKLPVILLLACNALALAVERPSGFLGIAWGASPEEAKRVLQKRPGVTFPENADDYKVELTGGTFAGQPVAKWVIEFPDRKFAAVTVTLKIEGTSGAVYKELRDQLVSKYGSVTMDKRSGGSKKAGQPQPASSSAIWKFTPSLRDKNSVLISAEISGATIKGGEETGGTVTIKYVNETLTGASAAAATGGKPAPKTATVKKEDL